MLINFVHILHLHTRLQGFAIIIIIIIIIIYTNIHLLIVLSDKFHFLSDDLGELGLVLIMNGFLVTAAVTARGLM